MIECMRTEATRKTVTEQRWIPVKYHELTEEERKECLFSADIKYMIDCELPDDEQEIIVTDGRHSLPDAVEFVKLVKKASVEAMEAAKPVNVYFGEVVGTSPLRINVEQKMILGESQIVLTRNVTDFKTAVTVSWNTDDNSATLSGRKEITVHNGLAVSDKVLLIRQQSGQKYFVMDRIG